MHLMHLARYALLLLTLAAITVTTACSGPSGATSRDASGGVRAYVAALRADDASQAYAMLTEQTKRELTYEQFEAVWKEHKAERIEQAKALEEGLRGEPDLGERAQIRYGEGKTVSMVREGGAWKLESGLVSRVHASRPEDAVRILAEALATRDFDSLMSVLTSRRRNGISSQVDALSSSLLEHLGDDVNLIGPDRAELTWETESTRYKVVLRKEGREWRVDDFHIRSKRP